MIPVHSGTFPKIGDCVERVEESGLFEVVDVNLLMETANLKATDGECHVTRYVPWSSLKIQGAASRQTPFLVTGPRSR